MGKAVSLLHPPHNAGFNKKAIDSFTLDYEGSQDLHMLLEVLTAK